MQHELYSSIDEMLAPHCLSELTGANIRTVRLRPLSDREGVSGNQLLAVETDNNARFILKRMSLERDWIMRASNDHQCRSVTLWQTGVLDQLQPELSHAIIGCARDDNGWAILMQDVSRGLLPWDRHIDATANESILRAMACQHARFWDAPSLTQPELGLCTLPELIAVTTPGPFVPDLYKIGLDLLPQVFEPDVANILRQLTIDPQPLCSALACYPHTLVHGDYKVTNLAWNVSPQLQLAGLDWQLAAVGLPTLDLGWYVSGFSHSFPAPPARCIERYHEHLVSLLGSRFDERRWQPMLALGLLTTVVRNCCFAAWIVTHDESQIRRNTVRQKLPMWSDWVRAGVKWL